MDSTIEIIARRLDARTGRALAAALSSAVGEGLLAPDSLLPPIRVVATELAMSASTVSAAWEMLSRAGVIRTDGRRGTRVVRHHSPGPTRYRRALHQSDHVVLDLSSGVPDAALLPDLGAALRHVGTTSAQNYLDDPLLPELRHELMIRWPYSTNELTVVDGAMDAVDQVLRLLVRVGDTVIVEHPTFPPFLDLLDAMGARTVAVALDDEGMRTDELRHAIDSPASVLLCQPRCHNPTGVSTSPRRARALATVLASWSGVVVEDDSAGDISRVAPLSLGKWRRDATVHIQSFSKSHGPDLRLAAVSAPPELMRRLVDRRLLGQGWTSRLLQSLLVELLTRPASVAQVARARESYGARRDSLVAELKKRGVEVMGGDGINIWLPVKDETAAMLLLAGRGIAVAAGGPFETRDDANPHVRLTIATVASGVHELARTLSDAAEAEPAWGPR